MIHDAFSHLPSRQVRYRLRQHVLGRCVQCGRRRGKGTRCLRCRQLQKARNDRAREQKKVARWKANSK